MSMGLRHIHQLGMYPQSSPINAIATYMQTYVHRKDRGWVESEIDTLNTSSNSVYKQMFIRFRP